MLASNSNIAPTWVEFIVMPNRRQLRCLRPEALTISKHPNFFSFHTTASSSRPHPSSVQRDTSFPSQIQNLPI
ncbi:hypothetical protein VTN96DRAFT_3988 [Rasamsonia emersonii]